MSWGGHPVECHSIDGRQGVLAFGAAAVRLIKSSLFIPQPVTRMRSDLLYASLRAFAELTKFAAADVSILHILWDCRRKDCQNSVRLQQIPPGLSANGLRQQSGLPGVDSALLWPFN